MILKYDLDIDKEAIQVSLKRLINQTYKLLPIREEMGNWERPLETIIEELAGMQSLFYNQQPLLYKLSCKLEGLFSLTEEDDFMTYRGVIFECLGLLGEFKDVFK